MKKAFSYNIHDIVTIASEGELPELKPFMVAEEIQEPMIRVRIGYPDPKKANGHYLHYKELFGSLGFEIGIEMGETVEVTAAPPLLHSLHVLYTNVVEPLLRWTFVQKGYALVHGATISFGNKAYIITARTDTGKTTTLLKMLSYQRRLSDQAGFLSDDMTIVSPEGQAFTYPKPLTISYHTLRAINSDTLNLKEKLALPIQSRIHSRSGRRIAFFISKAHLPAATINLIAQMMVPPPKYFVDKLLPKVKLTDRAYLAGMFVIERGNAAITSIASDAAMEVLLQNCEDAYGFPPYEAIKEFLYLHDDEDLRNKEHAIIWRALGGLPATVFRSNDMDWWSQIPNFVNKQMAKDIARAAEVALTGRARKQLVGV